MTAIHFPQYRRLIGADHLYRIDGPDRFIELQRIGRRWVMHVVHADAYPEKARIMEMLADTGNTYGPSGPVEWASAMEGVGPPGTERP
jgi:hypothetical protein